MIEVDNKTIFSKCEKQKLFLSQKSITGGRGDPLGSIWDFSAAGPGSILQGLGLTTFPCCHFHSHRFIISFWQKQESESVYKYS